ncbi:hypothetical protein EYF80_054234 [Liparis tanakae]|uniref:Uncharacterized protein n=1 Tax=Liparis tanakae TaxID=230148 RepID=A0A4Z2F4H8_9TELE|nr:hypothetical protein EYF80_054234 [Liparis tanakae]
MTESKQHAGRAPAAPPYLVPGRSPSCPEASAWEPPRRVPEEVGGRGSAGRRLRRRPVDPVAVEAEEIHFVGGRGGGGGGGGGCGGCGGGRRGRGLGSLGGRAGVAPLAGGEREHLVVRGLAVLAVASAVRASGRPTGLWTEGRRRKRRSGAIASASWCSWWQEKSTLGLRSLQGNCSHGGVRSFCLSTPSTSTSSVAWKSWGYFSGVSSHASSSGLSGQRY